MYQDRGGQLWEHRGSLFLFIFCEFPLEDGIPRWHIVRSTPEGRMTFPLFDEYTADIPEKNPKWTRIA